MKPSAFLYRLRQKHPGGKNVFINRGFQFQEQGGISIGDGTRIGHNAVLATFNHGIAAGAVVTKDVPAGTVAAFVLARVIREIPV